MLLKDKVGIVTGASRGIGKSIACALAGEGARVVVAARTRLHIKDISGTIAETAEEIREAGGEALAIKTDITKEISIEKMVQETLYQWGRIDILVNNAATNFPNKFEEMSQKHWDKIMDVNLRGTVLCTRAVLPTMMQQHYGHIINISSVVTQKLSHAPFTGIAYDVSKVAMNRLTQGLAEELKEHGIAVNALMPDNTASEGWSYLNPDVDTSGWDSPATWGRYAAQVAALDPATFTGNLLTKDDLNTIQGNM
ncbi:MAG: SDR family NAD(P)-dependent oxidoreductase [Deltaproteobacteria bacterium]|nr:SDR family NAD(P)-dependent oxidoreductase [Deltaproteobacteria bacterium]